MKKPDFSRYAPLGMNLTPLKQTLIWGGIASVFWSFSFVAKFTNSYNDLFRTVRYEKILREGAIMTDFVDLIPFTLVGFLVLAIAMLAFCVYNYAYHRQGSKSIYLMRRLPNRWELHKRCLTLPLISILLCAVAAFIILCIYYWIYMAVTPEQCLTPGQWQKIWRVFL